MCSITAGVMHDQPSWLVVMSGLIVQWGRVLTEKWILKMQCKKLMIMSCLQMK